MKDFTIEVGKGWDRSSEIYWYLAKNPTQKVYPTGQPIWQKSKVAKVNSVLLSF